MAQPEQILLDQVDAKVARAKRAFRQSRRIIVAARDELESHKRWLNRHRAAWADEVKHHRRLINRRMAFRGFTRFVVGLILVAPSALARFKEGPTRASSQLSIAETALHRTRHAHLQHRIRGRDGQLCTMKAAVLRPIPGQIEMRRGCSSTPDGASSRALALLGSLLKGRALVSALGLTTFFLIAAGAVRATISSPPTEAPVLAAPKVLGPPQLAAGPSVTVPKSPGKTQRAAPVSGFAVLAAASTPEPLLLPAQTIAGMLLITSPLPPAHVEPETATAPIAEKPLATKPAMKVKPERKLGGREPQQLPWWQRWSGKSKLGNAPGLSKCWCGPPLIN